MKMISRTIAGLGLVAAFASVGQAQYLTDAGSPMGSGAGVTGSVVNFVGGVNAATVSRVSAALSNRGSSPAAGALNAVGQALAGNPTALSSILSGVTGGGALAQALAALGNTPSPAAAVDAIRAFNAAVDGGAQPGSPAYIALQGAQFSLTILGARPAR
ncbi:MAG TPA: hypothetical protein PK788_10330 [Gemmatimonadaceae bacterium]|nr:hypothetical protein [Gemmatimonadaceae bacterium]HRQ79369.1 hypothetical protein [Gemmatimonadaceae bacterium]